MTSDTESRTLPLNGTTISLGSATITFRVSGDDTGGAYSVLEYRAETGAGSPLHVHHNEDESFFILEGAITFQLGDERSKGTPSTFLRIPKGLRHAFVNAESEPARTLIILTPAGLEYFFAELDELGKAYPAGPPAELVQGLAEKYGLNFNPPAE